MTTAARRLGERSTQSAGCGQLVLWPVAGKNLSHLEQGDVGMTTVGIALDCHDQTRKQARTHVGEFSSDGIGERQLGLAAAEQLRFPPGNERPGDGLDEPAGGECALGLAGPILDRGEHWLARMLPREWR